MVPALVEPGWRSQKGWVLRADQARSRSRGLVGARVGGPAPGASAGGALLALGAGQPVLALTAVTLALSEVDADGLGFGGQDDLVLVGDGLRAVALQ